MDNSTLKKIVLGGSLAPVLGLILLSPNQLKVAALGALPTGIITYFLVDGKAAKKEREAEEKTSIATTKFNQLNTQYQTVLTNFNKAVANESALKNEVGRLKALVLVAVENDNLSTQTIKNLTNSIQELEQTLSSATGEIEELQAEIQQWELSFHSQLETETNKQFQAFKARELNAIFDEHDTITLEAMELFKKLQNWGVKVASGHEAKREIIKSMASNYNSHLDQLNSSVSNEVTSYLQQIELLNERVGYLQQELAGELIEPVYVDFGFDTNGKIANSLAKEIYKLVSIPLSVKGFEVKSDGSVEIGYGYSKSANPTHIVDAVKSLSKNLAISLGLHKITSVKKLVIADIISVTYRLDAALKDDDIKLLVGTAEEFINYVVNHPIRYRLIANPGEGKSPTTAVMISAILKSGCRRGNTSKGVKVENTLITVSYPGVESSLKDADYPLDIFLKYGTETSANKSFSDAVDDWKFRKTHVNYAEKFFQIWVWDELDNTLDSASEPQASADNLKKILKQGGHNNIGCIVSGQSVMTKQIKGFTNDDRTLFTEIIIGIPKIRKYLSTYGKQSNSESNLAKLSKNLDEIEEYIETKNSRITDDARKLRLALVMDSRSPKLYFLPCLDSVNFDVDAINQTRNLADGFKRSIASLNSQSIVSLEPESIDNRLVSSQSESTIEGRSAIPHCPHCGSSSVKLHGDGRYQCQDCKKRVVASKIVFK